MSDTMQDTAKTKRPALIPGSPVTIGTKYDYAMMITDEAEAQSYFEACVKHTMAMGKSRADSECIERINLGYYAGYYSNETRQRVERLFNCEHPMFGKATETPVDAGKALLTGAAAANHGVAAAVGAWAARINPERN